MRRWYARSAEFLGGPLMIVVLAVLFYLFGGQLLGTKHTNINVNVAGPAQSG